MTAPTLKNDKKAERQAAAAAKKAAKANGNGNAPVANGEEAATKRSLLRTLAGPGKAVANPWDPWPDKLVVIELDGNHAFVASVNRGRIDNFAEFAGDDPAAACAKAIKEVPRRVPVLVVLAGGLVQARRQNEFPAVLDKAMRAVFDAEARHFSMAGNPTVSGRMAAIDGQRVAGVAAASSDLVEKLYELGSGHATFGVAAAPLRYALDGLYVGIGYGAVDVLWVADGLVRAYRVLATVPGIDGLAAQLDGPGGAGSGRLVTVMKGYGSDLDAARAIDEYVSRVVSETTRTRREFGQQTDEDVPRVVYLHGPGISLPSIGDAFGGAELRAMLAPFPEGVPANALEALPETDRIRAWAPLSASQLPVGTVYELFPDDAARRKADAKREAARRSTVRVRVILGVALSLMVMVVPNVLARLDKSNAKADLEKAQAALTPELVAWTDFNTALETREAALNAERNPRWGPIFGAVYSSVPANATLRSFRGSLTAAGLTIKLEASLPDRPVDMAAVSEWVRTLSTRLGATADIPNFIKTDGGGVTATVDLLLPLDDRFAPNLPQLPDSGAPAPVTPAAGGTTP